MNGDASTDFYTCKACHLDNGKGGHFEWQLLVDDPALAADFLAGKVKLTAEQEAKYGYKTTLMNDVHMSHSMEFPYPQSMANCVTCHEGKLDRVLSDANFKIETCKSCHPVTGAKAAASGRSAGMGYHQARTEDHRAPGDPWVNGPGHDRLHHLPRRGKDGRGLRARSTPAMTR